MKKLVAFGVVALVSTSTAALADDIAVGNARVPRIGPKAQPLTPTEQSTFNRFVRASVGVPPGLGIVNWRDPRVAGDAATKALPAGAKSLGKLAVFMPGAGNFGPSAAFVLRLARYFDNVVVAYQNTGDPAKNKLQRLSSLEGATVPSGLNVFAIGDGDNRTIIGPDQGSDQLIEYFAMMAQSGKLGDVLNSEATLFGHSEGSYITVLTRERLTQAGFPKAVGRVVTLGGGLGDPLPGDLPRSWLALIQAWAEFPGSPPDAKRMVPAFLKYSAPEWRKAHVGLVDLGVAAVIGPAIHFSIFKPLASLGLNNIRPQLRLAAIGVVPFGVTEMSPLDFVANLRKVATAKYLNTDGLVPLNASKVGKRTLVLDTPHDHAGLIEDPAVVDAIAKELLK